MARLARLGERKTAALLMHSFGVASAIGVTSTAPAACRAACFCPKWHGSLVPSVERPNERPASGRAFPVAPDLIRQNVEREVVKAAMLRDMSRFDPNAN
jgi:hypothetical protein